MKVYRRRLRVNSLPLDLTVEIAARLTSSSPMPLRDLKNLRTACRTFRDASKSRKVGMSVAVQREWNKHWWDTEGYFALLRHCARSGNLHASYVLGLHCLHNLQRGSSGERLLRRASDGGHRSATYVLGIFLFGASATRSRGMDLLNRVSFGERVGGGATAECTRSGNPRIERCRQEAKQVLRRIARRGRTPEPRARCGDLLCGRVIAGSDRWLLPENLSRSFCSQECRWRDEYYTFHSHYW